MSITDALRSAGCRCDKPRTYHAVFDWRPTNEHREMVICKECRVRVETTEQLTE